MKIKKITWYTVAAIMVMFTSCSDETLEPVLGSRDSFKAPVLLAPAEKATVEFNADNLGEKFEDVTWETADYGVNVSVRYVIEATLDEEFNKSVSVKEIQGNGTSGQRSTALLNREVNAAMLALGIPSGEQGEIKMRVFSFINGIERDTLVSNAVTRSAIPFRSSDCGNFCTMGIVGSATAGGWDVDTDMRLADPEGADKSMWTVTLYLIGGEKVKFRAQDAWDDNWGGVSFAAGVGVKGGADITVPTSGYYKVTFNDQTGAYTFVQAGATTFTTMGLIGEQSNWNSDIADLTKSNADPHVWTATVALQAGKLKFRANDSWDNNWGATDFPSGFGTSGGPDITIPVTGTYFVYFNDASGEYFFGPAAAATPYASIGILGSATAGGWETDTDLQNNPSNKYRWSGFITLSEGEAKFRSDNSWDTSWGASGFPSGVAALGGGNIPVQAGTYFVTFNTASGEYYFLR